MQHTPVTNPDLLRQLNEPGGLQPVTDPGLLQQLQEGGGEIFRTVDDIVRSMAAGVTGTYADEIAAKMTSLTGIGQQEGGG